MRLSEKIWGYAISYRAEEKCKHYLVNASHNYHFCGNNQMEHETLGKKHYSLQFPNQRARIMVVRLILSYFTFFLAKKFEGMSVEEKR